MKNLFLQKQNEINVKDGAYKWTIQIRGQPGSFHAIVHKKRKPNCVNCEDEQCHNWMMLTWHLRNNCVVEMWSLSNINFYPVVIPSHEGSLKISGWCYFTRTSFFFNFWSLFWASCFRRKINFVGSLKKH